MLKDVEYSPKLFIKGKEPGRDTYRNSARMNL